MNVERKSEIKFDVILANARSMESKLDSAFELFEEHDISALFVCETWLKTGSSYIRVKEEIEDSKGLKLISYNRPGKRVGGGVCIISDPAKISLEENKFTRRSYEIVSAHGRE